MAYSLEEKIVASGPSQKLIEPRDAIRAPLKSGHVVTLKETSPLHIRRVLSNAELGGLLDCL